MGDWQAKLVQALSLGEGVRFGEAAVISRRLHLTSAASPDEVTILVHQDAGQVFYGRAAGDEVVHIDVFHQEGTVDHRQAAAAVRAALARAEHPELADFFDVQTATGGGRLSGDLSGGRRPSLRAAHQNHVHVAGLLPEGNLAILRPVVAAVENVIGSQGLEIRQIAMLRHQRQPGSAPLDLSPYSDYTDSFLRGSDEHQSPAGDQPAAGGEVGGVPRGPGGGFSGAPAVGNGPGTVSGSLRSAAGSPGRIVQSLGGGDVSLPAGGLPGIAEELQVQRLLALARRVGSPEELRRILDSARAGSVGEGLTTAAFASPSLRELENEGLLRREVRGLRLTQSGKALAEYLDTHLRELTLRFRRLVRRTPRRAPVRPGSQARPSAQVRSGPIRGTEPVGDGTWLGSIAVSESLRAAAARSYMERVGTAPAPTGRPVRLHLTRRDIHVYRRVADPTLNICLLIDASASMAGKRIQAAKHLVRHLLASTCDRLAVVGFQERQVQVHVPFTRSHAVVESGLAHLQPLGLTPLAHGLTTGADLIKAARVRRPLLLLITDGIPTVPQWTQDPLADALRAARHLADARIPFGCIGLMPARRYLEELSRMAGGRLHVVEELDAEALITIAHRERKRHLGR